MLKKLKLAFKSPKGSLLLLALKAGVFFTLLTLVRSHWSIVAVFVLTAFFFYFRPFLNTRQFLSSFLILLTFSLLTIFTTPKIGHFLPPSSLIAFFLGFLFFLLLGIKNLVFVNRQPFYHLLNGFLFLLIFIFFFSADKSQLFFVKYLLTFLAIFFLFKEFLSVLTTDSLSSQKRRLAALGTAFLILQLVWAIALLPINFLNASSLALLIVLILQDFLMHHFSGTINRQIILRNITIFLVLALVIFAASKWTV